MKLLYTGGREKTLRHVKTTNRDDNGLLFSEMSDSPLAARITQLVRGFSSTWKQSVESMSQDVMRSFTNFKNGTSIIQVRRQVSTPIRKQHTFVSLLKHSCPLVFQFPCIKKVSGFIYWSLGAFHKTTSSISYSSSWCSVCIRGSV